MRYTITFELSAESIGEAFAAGRRIVGEHTALVVVPAPCAARASVELTNGLVRDIPATRWEARARGVRGGELVVAFTSGLVYGALGPAGVVLLYAGRAPDDVSMSLRYDQGEPVGRIVLPLDQLSELIRGLGQFPGRLIDELQASRLARGV